MMRKNSKATDAEDLLGSDGSEWLEEVNQKLGIDTPDSTLRKRKILKTPRPKTLQTTIDTTNKYLTAIDLHAPSKTPSPFNSAGRPTKFPFSSSRARRTPTVPELTWISSEEECADTDTDSDSDLSSIFDRGQRTSRKTTMSSISSSSEGFPTKRNFLEPDSGLHSAPPKHAVPNWKPIMCHKLTLSPSQSLSSNMPSPSDDDPFASSPVPSPGAPVTSFIMNSPNTSESMSEIVPATVRTTSGECFIIAHDRETQELFDNVDGPVPWGTQYELSRGVNLRQWAWEDVRKKIHHFAGSSDGDVMDLVYYIMKDMTPPKSLKRDIGQESDREQFAILENQERGLGLMGRFFDVDDWFGGQIQQIATLRQDAKSKLFLQLEPLEMRRSTRLARQFGSRRILQVRIVDDFLRAHRRQSTIRFLSRKFVLNGRVYAPTPPKEGTVYLVEINEDYDRTAMRLFGDHHRKSLREVLEWHNPMSLNAQQPMSKYAARAALALSNSVPALIFEVDNIHFIGDIIASDCTEKKPPAHKVLTDGCGFMNEAALRAIATALHYASRPTAVQGRIAGSKGLWTIHPDKNINASTIPQIWIRDSQRKIVYPHFDMFSKHYTSLDKAHRIFDLCHAALPSLSTAGSIVSLKKQSALNLWANGVPIELFKELMDKGLQEIIEPLTHWNGQFAMPALWDAINKAGKVSHARTTRLGAGMARAMGLAARDYNKEGSIQSEGDAISPIFSSTVTGRNEFSGAPMSLCETAIELVQSGFHPAEDSMLWSTIEKVLEVTVQGAIDKCSIPLPEGSAATAFVIPDPLGVLDENEIYYRSSTPMRDPDTQTLFHVITGEVLIYRYPLRVTSDTQKVIAVDKPELAPWSDVFIVPIKPSPSKEGFVSMMSKCSGGDQDGDDLCGIWLDCLVKSFKVSPLVLEPKDIPSNFEDKVEKVDDFLKRIEPIPDAESNLISAFLEGLTDSNVGIYDTFHEKAVRHKGYQSDKAVRLAFLFNRLLDAPKTGAVLRGTVLTEDRTQSRASERSLERRMQSNSQEPFIFDELESFGRELLKTTMTKFKQLPPPSSERSNVLLEPYQMAQRFCKADSLPTDVATKIAKSSDFETRDVVRIILEARRLDLRLIEQHVDQAFVKFCSITGIASSARDFQDEKKKKAKGSQADVMDPVIALYAREIPGLTNSLQNVEQVKASYAYSKGKTINFGKTVAFRTLCEIQVAASSEGGAPCSRLLDQVKSISGGARRLFQQ